MRVLERLNGYRPRDFAYWLTGLGLILLAAALLIPGGQHLRPVPFMVMAAVYTVFGFIFRRLNPSGGVLCFNGAVAFAALSAFLWTGGVEGTAVGVIPATVIAAAAVMMLAATEFAARHARRDARRRIAAFHDLVRERQAAGNA